MYRYICFLRIDDSCSQSSAVCSALASFQDVLETLKDIPRSFSWSVVSLPTSPSRATSKGRAPQNLNSQSNLYIAHTNKGTSNHTKAVEDHLF